MADTPRGYPVPASTDVVSLDAVQDLADAIDTDVTSVASAAGSALASHEADTTSVHGIANTALLVKTSDTGTVSTAMIADSAVTSAKIADGTIVTGDLADSAVTSAKIADATIVTGDLADSAVTSAKIADGTIVNADVNAAAAIAATKVAGTAVTQADTGTVTNTMLAGSIAPAKVTGTAVVTGDSRLSDARTPTAHAASHGTGQADAITIAPAQVTGTAVVNTIVDAKGDLIAATAADTPARMAVGNSGDLLVPSSGAATGLAWRAPWPITASATGVTLDRANPVYTFTSGSVTATLPTASTHAGVRFLIRNAGSGSVTVSGISGLTIPGAGYVDVVSDGSAWLVLDGGYTDESVGRRIFAWDAVNARWQQTYGDTGWRDVTASLAGAYLTADPNALLHLRRFGDRVELRLARGASGTWTYGTIYTLPEAFRFLPSGAAAHIASTGLMDYSSAQESAATLWTATSEAGLEVNGWSAAVDYRGHLAYSTDSAWPTSLPGTAVGSIPA